jgi:HlyD family secretion protein
MSRQRIILIVLAFLLLGAIFFWYRLSPDAVEIMVAPVEQGAVEKIVANTRAGTVKACRQAHMSPAIGGQLSLLAVHEGERVKEGQLLLELWNKDLLAEEKLASSSVKTAIAQAESARIQAENAGREAKRLHRLLQINAIAAETLDKASSTATALDYTHRAALAAVESSEARLGVVTASLERTRLFAPFSGIIAKIHGELGEYITPSPPGIATLPTIELLDTSCFFVTAPIDEVDAARITVDAKARISMDAFPGRHFAATIRRIAPFVLDLEKQARTVEVEVEFSNPEETRNLLAGYSADVEIVLEERDHTLRIPTQALLPGNRVFVYHPQKERVEERNLQIGISNWDRTEVMEGLQTGDQVVLSIDKPGLKNGVRATVAHGQESESASKK